MIDKPIYRDWRKGAYALLRDCLGKRFRTTREMANGVVTIPPGILCTITTAYRWHAGISIKCDPSPHCGVKAHISRISWLDIEGKSNDG